MARLAFGIVILIAVGRPVAAGVCVTLDEQRDTLSMEDRRAALITFGRALAKAGVEVTDMDCTTTYVLYNVKLGGSISVYANGPLGNREARASKLEELPLVYEQVAASLVTNQPMGTGGNTVDRTNVTNDQMVPRRTGADNVKLIRLGYGAVAGGSAKAGPSMGLGWRLELDRVAIEISGLNAIIAGDSHQHTLTGDLLRLSAFYYTHPIANETTYFGGGIGWGGVDHYDVATMTDHTGSGIEGTLTAGYEALRSSTIRMFVELDATVPFYAGGGFSPSISLSLGLGYGKPNTLGVVSR